MSGTTPEIDFGKILKDLNDTERGNIWLLDVETGSHTNAWLRLAGDWWLEITIRPDNYPGLTVSTIETTDEALQKHIQTTCDGMLVRKCCLEGVVLRNKGSWQVVANLEYEEENEE